MELISNGVEPSDSPQEAALFLSGFGAETEGETVKKIFDLYGSQGITAYTFHKPGSEERLDGSKFSLEQLAKENTQHIDRILESHRKIRIGGVSMSFISCAKGILHRKDNVSRLIGFSPVLDPNAAVLNTLKLMKFNVPEVTSDILDMLGKHKKVRIDNDAVLPELEEYIGGINVALFIASLKRSVETQIFYDPRDKIISPDIIEDNVHSDKLFPFKSPDLGAFHSVNLKEIKLQLCK